MKQRLFILLLLALFSIRGMAQFVSQGQLFVGPAAPVATNDAFTNSGTLTNQGVISFSANVTNNGTFETAGGEIQLTGTTAQTVGGTTGFTLKILTLLNTASGQSVVLNVPVQVTQSVNFTDGILRTDATNLLILSDNAQALSAGDGSHVVGPVRKIGDDAFLFPLGNGTAYRPASITPQGGVNDTYTAQYVESTPPQSANRAPCLVALSTQEYWQIDHTAGNGSARVGLAYMNVATSSAITSSTALRVTLLAAGQWVPVSCSANGGTFQGIVSTDGNSPSFGAFTLGQGGAVQPCTLNPTQFTTNTPEGLAVQVSGGVSYERVRVIDRVNGYEIRQTEQNQTGYFLITQRGPYTITVIGANGCRATVTGTF